MEPNKIYSTQFSQLYLCICKSFLKCFVRNFLTFRTISRFATSRYLGKYFHGGILKTNCNYLFVCLCRVVQNKQNFGNLCFCLHKHLVNPPSPHIRNHKHFTNHPSPLVCLYNMWTTPYAYSLYMREVFLIFDNVNNYLY